MMRIKASIVLHRHVDPAQTQYIYFFDLADEQQRTHTWVLTNKEWVEFGKPDTITLTAVPSDIPIIKEET